MKTLMKFDHVILTKPISKYNRTLLDKISELIFKGKKSFPISANFSKKTNRKQCLVEIDH